MKWIHCDDCCKTSFYFNDYEDAINPKTIEKLNWDGCEECHSITEL
jgi:hypothetical protein